MSRGFTHESSHNESQEWYTPPEIFKALNCSFDLDPCSPADRILEWIPTKKRLTIHDNGLSVIWKGFVWMNPPYGQDTPLWMEKLSKHGEGIALVFARTDTSWFQKWAKNASCICFVSKRIKFVRADGRPASTPGAGSMLIGYGEKAREVLLRSNLGLCFELSHSLKGCFVEQDIFS